MKLTNVSWEGFNKQVDWSQWCVKHLPEFVTLHHLFKLFLILCSSSIFKFMFIHVELCQTPWCRSTHMLGSGNAGRAVCSGFVILNCVRFVASSINSKSASSIWILFSLVQSLICVGLFATL